MKNRGVSTQPSLIAYFFFFFGFPVFAFTSGPCSPPPGVLALRDGPLAIQATSLADFVRALEP